jgi:type I restriction enzyme M protein
VLDAETKQRIDSLRNILVGKIPNPQSQVEQITTGLIYKFMNDMDQESIEMGGEGSFFVGDYKQYSWDNLFDTKLSGVDKVKLYSDAIEGMYLNPNAPELFRNIFKNAFLPFKDPSTLNMFLKEINEFHYSHSEKLGDAFEYLISIMGSQGDAGQFRTPRHIIDFIVEIINPKKHETVLDPACGTGGFLISSYKHILKTNTDKKSGDLLSASDRKKVGENIGGYDISPEMIKLSLVNMYLHGFSTPDIEEYDTLSSEDKWNEYYDVILANPPFFSPTGGIQPHKRFGVDSNKAEVLFTSYILEHLKPNGRAGIIIPEGIIFQSTTKAYIELRKQLIDNGLIGVISLPAGVFNPYSPVKTSILILDKKESKERDSIFFVEVKNDGFSLGAQRNEIEENDLPELCLKIKEYDDSIFKVSKLKLSQSKDFSLSSNKYKEVDLISSTFDLVNIKDHADFKRGTSKSKKDLIEGKIPVVAGGMQPAYYCNESNRDENIITISSSGANAGFVNFYTEKIFATDCFTIESNPNSLNQEFLFRILKGRQKDIFEMQSGAAQPHVYARDFDNFIIPLPSLEVQQEIVDELEGYQKIIDGCKQVVENYKPTIDIDPSWEMVELGEVCEMIKRGITPKYAEKDGLIVINQKCIREHSINLEESRLHNNNEKKVAEEKFVKYGDVLVNSTGVGTLGRVAQYIDQNDIDLTVDSHVTIVRPKKGYFEDNFFGYVMIMIENQIMKSGKGSTGQTELSRVDLSEMRISFPKDKLEQKEIVQKLEEERTVIESNKKLIENYTQKIQNRINKVWGEE